MTDDVLNEPEVELDRSTAVTVGYLNSNDVCYSWHHSMIELIGWDLAHHARVLRGGYVAVRFGTGGIVEARNKVVRQFLDDREADWLFWVDTDMGFSADTVDRLMEAADPVERPIVGALAFTQREDDPDGIGGFRCTAVPTIFDWVEYDGHEGFAIRWDYPKDTLTQVAGTGTACILVHRSVFERIEAEFGPVWYSTIFHKGMNEMISEDLSFCVRAGGLDIPRFVHTGVKTSHAKRLWLSETDYWMQRAVNPPPLTAEKLKAVPPAEVETAVIVPVMKRPQNAQPFMDSLLDHPTKAEVYAIANEADVDTIEAWAAAGANVITGDVTTFAEKVNLGFRKTGQPFIFICGDDVKFHNRWLDHAQAVAGERYHVIGTNDLGNPRVKKGEHATHLLIRRSYVDEMGASWDDPGLVAHEGYRHWCVDDELVTAAKQRGVWAMARLSIVEHMHPLWGKGKRDDVYELGSMYAKQDMELFKRRCEIYL